MHINADTFTHIHIIRTAHGPRKLHACIISYRIDQSSSSSQLDSSGELDALPASQSMAKRKLGSLGDRSLKALVRLWEKWCELWLSSESTDLARVTTEVASPSANRTDVFIDNCAVLGRYNVGLHVAAKH